MTKKTIAGIIVTAVLTTPILLYAGLITENDVTNIKKVNADTYSMTLNSTAFAASNLTTSYQEIVTQDFGTSNCPIMNYYLAKKNNNNNLVLAPSGRIYNYSASKTYHGRITNLVSMSVTYSGGSSRRS